MKHYGIEVIGYGARRRYVLKEIMPGRGTNPVNGRVYMTLGAAQRAAAQMGLDIERIGDFYALIA